MTDADIKAGVVYGVVPRWQYRPQPEVVLEEAPRSIFVRGLASTVAAGRQDGRLFVGGPAGDGERGFAAVTSPADALEGLDCAGELARLHAGLKPSRAGLQWTLVTQLSQVRGRYGDVARAYDDEQSALLAGEAERRAEVDGVLAELAARGIQGAAGGYHDASVTLPAAQVRRLLAQGQASRPLPLRPGGVRARCRRCRRAGGRVSQLACLPRPAGGPSKHPACQAVQAIAAGSARAAGRVLSPCRSAAVLRVGQHH